MTVRLPFVLAVLLLASCGVPGPEGEEVFRGEENGRSVRVGRVSSDTYRVTTRHIGDSRNPDEVQLMFALSPAETVIGRFCTNGQERLPGSQVVPAATGPGTQRAYDGSFTFRCRPDPRSAAELEALDRAPRGRPHPCGLIFGPDGRVSSAPC